MEQDKNNTKKAKWKQISYEERQNIVGLSIICYSYGKKS